MAKLQMSCSLPLRLLFICVGVLYVLTQLPHHLLLAFFSAPCLAGEQEMAESLHGDGGAGFGRAFHVLRLLAGLSTIASGLLLLKQQMFSPTVHPSIVGVASSEEEEGQDEDEDDSAAAEDQLLDAHLSDTDNVIYVLIHRRRCHQHRRRRHLHLDDLHDEEEARSSRNKKNAFRVRKQWMKKSKKH